MLKVIFWAVYVHFVLLYSIFDIYFKSPVIHGMTPINNEFSPPAKRLVLIVSDGLRAEALYEAKYFHHPMPYLRSIIENGTGSWGISHTRVPTESRPGHVALIAGMYEDPSAVWKGWKVNPVEFDTIFNQSNMAWCWGSPDIVNLFKFSNNRGNVVLHSYDAEFEDFSGSTSTRLLDKWVFDKFEEFVKETSGKQECGKFCETKIIFFLHLLGMDTAGHVFKPYSQQYYANMIEVDSSVRKVVELLEKAFPDKGTAYIFTADHGMTNWGSHGAGLPHETQTPLVTWGAGINHSQLQKDVNQADIAPLMATLLGLPIPVNSMGILPISYLNTQPKHTANAIYMNALQLLAQFNVKHKILSENSFSLLFHPFKPLDGVNLKLKLNSIKEALDGNEYHTAINNSLMLINKILSGLQYYQNYHQLLLLSCTAFGTIFWILYLTSVINSHGPRAYIWEYHYRDAFYKKIQTIANLIAASLFALVLPLLYFQNMSITFYIYVTFPIITGWLLLYNIKLLHVLKDRIFSVDRGDLAMIICVYVFGIEMLILAFFNRYYISILICFLGFWGRNVQSDTNLKNYWTGTSLILMIFPFFNIVGEKYNVTYMNVTGITWTTLFLFLFNCDVCPIGIENLRCVITFTAQTMICVIAFLNTLIVNYSVDNKNGIWWISQCVSWIILGLSFVTPLFGSNFVISRVVNIILAFLAPYILMSVKQEPLFILVLCANLLGWLLIEYKTLFPDTELLLGSNFRPYRIREKRLDRSDIRLAFFFIYFIMVSFFGTGNIASLNSFDPACIRTFISVFSPFTMMSLLLVKLLVPFFITTVVFLAITQLTKAIVSKLFFLILIFCEVMTLHFLFMVKNVGSWLDIGQSISHFAIMNLITIFLLILFIIAKGLTMYTIRTFDVPTKSRLNAN